jgi:hypothetical protein
MSLVRILHCEVRNARQPLEPGHWFFHEGQWAVCAEAGRSGGRKWRLKVLFAAGNKGLPEAELVFPTLNAANAFLADYFEAEIARVRATDMPTPEEL